MSSKLILIGIAITTVGLVALPQTLALFSGQHNFYDTMGTHVYGGGVQTNIPCQKCHSDVGVELDQPGGVNSIHKSQGCAGCHMSTAPRNENPQLTNGPGGQFHAAAAPACLDCHGTLGPGANALNILNGPEEVHKPFANQANDTSKLLKGANEACITCHTHVAVQANWSKAYMMSFNAQEFTASDGTHGWTVNNFATQGYANITTYGNQSGGIYNSTQPPVISISPTPPGFNPNYP